MSDELISRKEAIEALELLTVFDDKADEVEQGEVQGVSDAISVIKGLSSLSDHELCDRKLNEIALEAVSNAALLEVTRAELSALRAAQPLTRAIEQIREILKGDYEASYDLINDISALLDSLADGETK